MIETSDSLGELVNKLSRYKQYRENSKNDADVCFNNLQIERIQGEIKTTTKELLLLTQKK